MSKNARDSDDRIAALILNDRALVDSLGLWF